MTLGWLKQIIHSPSDLPPGLDGLELSGLAYDSRAAGPGQVFFALKGVRTDGHRFIDQALEAGVAAVVGQEGLSESLARRFSARGAVYLRTGDSRAALALAAHEFFGRPTPSLDLVGVTGTSGKTTTTYALESILEAAGVRTGVIGTNNYRYLDKEYPAPVTTPESLDLVRLLAEMVRAGVRTAVMEVSSHALDQGRILGCRFKTAAFTNLSRDHLDYHADLEDYFQAKRRLFREHPLSLPAAVNIDDPYGQRLARELGGRAVTFGLAAEAEIRAEDPVLDRSGIRARIRTPSGDFGLDSPLLGGFNLSNLLAAAALAWLLEIPLQAAAQGLNRLQKVPGRMEDLGRPFGRRVIVDYSHKLEALERALAVVRELTPGRVITVFGCGGDRDRGKRPLMGRAAAAASDLVILTSDNPRSEEPYAILDQIAAGVVQAGAVYFEAGSGPPALERTGYTIVEDRRAAIRLAVAQAGPRDTVLIAGKGHEDYQIVGQRKLHLDDREEALEALQEARNRAEAGGPAEGDRL